MADRLEASGKARSTAAQFCASLGKDGIENRNAGQPAVTSEIQRRHLQQLSGLTPHQATAGEGPRTTYRQVVFASGIHRHRTLGQYVLGHVQGRGLQSTCLWRALLAATDFTKMSPCPVSAHYNPEQGDAVSIRTKHTEKWMTCDQAALYPSSYGMMPHWKLPTGLSCYDLPFPAFWAKKVSAYSVNQ